MLLVTPRADAQESGRGRGGREQLPDDVNAWLHIDRNSAITVFTGKTEVGQNIRTSLTQAVAEELHVPVASVTLVMADTARTPFDAGTFGSRQEEAQRLGRVLRPKSGGEEAHFYTLVTRDTRELDFAHHRQMFLTEQGYSYAILDEREVLPAKRSAG